MIAALLSVEPLPIPGRNEQTGNPLPEVSIVGSAASKAEKAASFRRRLVKVAEPKSLEACGLGTYMAPVQRHAYSVLVVDLGCRGPVDVLGI